MGSLFDPAAAAEIIERINRLKPDLKPEWGKMNPSQMMAHVTQAFRTATGELKLKRNLTGILFGSMVRKIALGYDEPFRKNSPTDKAFIIKDERNFEEEKARLISFVERFSKGGHAGVTKQAHPFFGKMTYVQWDLLMMKHLDHHLKQFGV